MERIGIFDAKTRFSEIVEQVQATGQSVTVTNRGKPVVDITPTHAHPESRMSREEAFAEIDRLRQEVPPMSREEIRDLIQEGRDRWPGV